MPEPLVFPSPPRRVLAAGHGAFMAELEDGIVAARKGDLMPSKICVPEEKGERLLWPLGTDRCVTLAPGGLVKIYERGRVAQRHSGIFAEDDELVGTTEPGHGQAAILLGRMTGDPLLLPSPEYRFLVLKHTAEVLAQPSLRLPRKPVGWGLHPGGSVIFVLVRGEESDQCLGLPLDARPAEELSPPPAVAGKRASGMAVEPSTGTLALTLMGKNGHELGLIKTPAKSPTYNPLTTGLEPLDQPVWSPDGHSLSYRREGKHGQDLMVVRVLRAAPKRVAALQPGDETLWLDGATLGVVRWDKLQRVAVP